MTNQIFQETPMKPMISSPITPSYDMEGEESINDSMMTYTGAPINQSIPHDNDHDDDEDIPVQKEITSGTVTLKETRKEKIILEDGSLAQELKYNASVEQKELLNASDQASIAHSSIVGVKFLESEGSFSASSPIRSNFQNGINCNNGDDDDEVSSLVSQYGSDAGAYSSRLDDIANLQPLIEEGQNEDENEESDGIEDWTSSVALGGTSEASEYIHRRSHILTKPSSKKRDKPFSLLEQKISKSTNAQQNDSSPPPQSPKKPQTHKKGISKPQSPQNIKKPESATSQKPEPTKSNFDTVAQTPQTPIPKIAGGVQKSPETANHDNKSLPQTPQTTKSKNTGSSQTPQTATNDNTDTFESHQKVNSKGGTESSQIPPTTSQHHHEKSRCEAPPLTLTSSWARACISTPIQNSPGTKQIKTPNYFFQNNQNNQTNQQQYRPKILFPGSNYFSGISLTGKTPAKNRIDNDCHSISSQSSTPQSGTVQTNVDSKDVSKSQNSILLSTSERVDIEGEDALNILSCLVERSVEFEEKSQHNIDITASVNTLKKISQEYDDNHQMRNDAIDELLRSHTYAMEMKQAALSASTWLRTIDRNSQRNSNNYNANMNNDLRAAKLEAILSDKIEQNERLNQELSKCRAEIGRLRSVSKADMHILSPDKSILDDDSASSVCSTEKNDLIDSSALADVSAIPESDDFNVDLSMNNDDEINSLKKALEEANSRLKEAGIKTIDHVDLGNTQLNGEGKKYVNEEVGIHSKKNDNAETEEIKILQNKLMEMEEKLMYKEKGMVHVKMLDGENFVTEWDDLTPPLAPPPDHGLRSPIVLDLLSQWTHDTSMQSELMIWMDQVLSGGSIPSVPLDITSLDHQVRDGFTMHILPLLLKRPDIHVKVTTRAHRNTSYDLSVVIESKPTNYEQNNMHMMAFHASSNIQHFASPPPKPESEVGNISVSHSAITTPISNLDEVSVGSSLTGASKSSQQQNSIMGAIGGAFGGFLSRRKAPAPSVRHTMSLDDDIWHESQNFSSHNSEPLHHSPPNLRSSKSHSPLKSKREDHPFHRVVSAPPGRIGITFVQIRGNCLVSDVSSKSPLLGWVFPTDVLIAIDELPVSGLPVREIVKILTVRKESQRALRMISSHAMTELTQHSAALMDS